MSLYNIADGSKVVYFYQSGQFQIPVEATMLFIIAIGSGGGGGAGLTGLASTARGGGAGGGSGTMSRLYIPVNNSLNGSLNITVGSGGSGGATSGSAGGTGTASIVELVRGVGAASTRLLSANGGQAGTARQSLY